MIQQLTTTIWLSNSLTAWACAVVAFAVTLGLLRLAQALVLAQLVRRAHDNAHPLSDAAVSVAQRTNFLFQGAVSIAAGCYFLELSPGWSNRLHTIVALATTLQIGLWANTFVRFALVALVDSRGDLQDAAHRSGRNMLRFFATVAVWSAVLLLGLDNLGINVSALVAGLGVTGVAVALATQNIVSDLFASISILLDKPFLVGDFVVVDTYMGTVERIGVRTTRLRSISGEEIILANGDLSKSRVRNFRTMRERRVVFGFSVRYETPLDTVKQIPNMVRDVIEQIDQTRFDRAEMLVFGESGLNYEVVYYVLDPNYNLYTNIAQRINLGIMQRLSDAQVSFAYKTTVVYNLPESIANKQLAA